MTDSVLTPLLRNLRARENDHIEKLVEGNEKQLQAIEEGASTETLLMKRTEDLKQIIFEQLKQRPRSRLLALFLGQRALKFRYGNEQRVYDMGCRGDAMVYSAPFVETFPLMATELSSPDGFEDYRFSQGWAFRIQVGYMKRLKTHQQKFMSAKTEPYALDTPLGLHLVVTEHVTGEAESEVRYLVASNRRSAIGASALRVFHNGQEQALLGQIPDMQLEVLGLINGGINELSS